MTDKETQNLMGKVDRLTDQIIAERLEREAEKPLFYSKKQLEERYGGLTWATIKKEIKNNKNRSPVFQCLLSGIDNPRRMYSRQEKRFLDKIMAARYTGEKISL